MGGFDAKAGAVNPVILDFIDTTVIPVEDFISILPSTVSGIIASALQSSTDTVIPVENPTAHDFMDPARRPEC